MTFPVVASLTPTAFDADATAHLVAMPATVNAGDLLAVGFTNDGAATVTTPGGGWQLLDSTPRGVACRLSLYYLIAAGTEGGTTVDFVTSATEKGAAHCYRITGWHGTTPPEIGVAAEGTSADPDPPNLAPSWGAADTLWLAWYGNDGATTTTAYPTNYTNGTNTVAAPAGGAGIASARRELNAASDDPGTFTQSASIAWVAETVAIRPSAGSVPAAPTNLVATAISTTRIDLAWDDNATDETSFRVERSPDGVGSWASVGTPAADATTFSNTGLTCATQYFYRVFAVNGIGDSLPSNTDSATTSACPPPPTPGGNRMGGTGAIRKPPR